MAKNQVEQDIEAALKAFSNAAANSQNGYPYATGYYEVTLARLLYALPREVREREMSIILGATARLKSLEQ